MPLAPPCAHRCLSHSTAATMTLANRCGLWPPSLGRNWRPKTTRTDRNYEPDSLWPTGTDAHGRPNSVLADLYQRRFWPTRDAFGHRNEADLWPKLIDRWRLLARRRWLCLIVDPGPGRSLCLSVDPGRLDDRYWPTEVGLGRTRVLLDEGLLT